MIFILALALIGAAPDFLDTLAIDYRSRKEIDKYWVPLDHPIRGWVDFVFSQPGVTGSVDSLEEAGFKILSAVPHHPIVTLHPSAKGYIFKIYPESLKYTREGISSPEWFLRRCQMAEKIRTLIRRKGIEHFVVPDKWLYRVPFAKQHPLLLIATDMDLADAGEIKNAWKTKITPKHLDELYQILSRGYGSIEVLTNIPYSKQGYFTLIDTETLKRDLDLHRVSKHLSKEMRSYWEKLID